MADPVDVDIAGLRLECDCRLFSEVLPGVLQDVRFTWGGANQYDRLSGWTICSRRFLIQVGPRSASSVSFTAVCFVRVGDVPQRDLPEGVKR
jgi:hypothetical protein